MPNPLEQILDASKAARGRTRELIAASCALHGQLASTVHQLRSLYLRSQGPPRSSAPRECIEPGRVNFWNNMARASELRHASEEVCIAFLRVELAIAFTFVRIASEAGNDAPKKQRNLTNARKAYQTILNWGERLSKSEGAAAQIQNLDAGLEAVACRSAKAGSALLSDFRTWVVHRNPQIPSVHENSVQAVSRRSSELLGLAAKSIFRRFALLPSNFRHAHLT